MALIHHLSVIAADVFDGWGQPPEKMTGDLKKVLGVVFWGVTGVTILALFLLAGQMAMSHRRGEGAEHIQGLMWIGFACFIAATASSVAGVVVG